MKPKALTGPRITAALVIAALVLAVWFLLRKPALEVDMAEVTRGPMQVSVSDLGETRVRDLYTVSSPVTGEVLRIPFKPGAQVTAGSSVLAEIQPVAPSPVDSRSYAETAARIAGLEAQLSAARAEVQQAGAAQRLAEADNARVAALTAKGFVSRAQSDAARAARDRTRAASAAARQGEDAALHALQAARASLRGSAGAPAGQVVRVKAPVSGAVMRVLHESAGPVVAGTALLELGDPSAIEIVSDMLSADAVKVTPGALVEIDAWGGEAPLKGKVRLVEPYGFTKISALGVEEQRVNVVIDLTDPAAARARLGHGYRVIVRVALWSAPEVLKVPLGALFRQGEGWAVFAVGSDGRARKVAVKVGHINDEAAEVLGGLSAGDRVVLHPGEKVADGVKVRPPA